MSTYSQIISIHKEHTFWRSWVENKKAEKQHNQDEGWLLNVQLPVRKFFLDYWRVAEDTFDDSLCNYNLLNSKAVFNLAHSYKYRNQQVKFKLNFNPETGSSYLLNEKGYRGHGKFSANETLQIRTARAKSWASSCLSNK